MKKINLILLLFAAGILVGSAGCAPDNLMPAAAEKTPSPGKSAVPGPTQAAELASLLTSKKALPPVVTGYRPASGEEAPLTNPIEIQFDQDMDLSSAEAAFKLKTTSGDTVDGAISWPDSRTLRFQPATPLQANSSYTVSLSTSAKAQNGAAMEKEVSFNVHTITRLQVLRMFPADGTTQAAISSQVTVMFNRPVVALGIAEEQQDLPQPLKFEPRVQGRGEWINTSVYVFTPDPPLKTGTKYTVTIPAGLETAEASPDTSLAQDARWQFSTLPPQMTGVQVGDTMILPGQDFTPTNVALIPEIVFNFGQKMDTAATNQAVYLREVEGANLPLRFKWETDGMKLTVTPSKWLKMGTAYRFGVGKQAAASDGGILDQDWTFSLTTIPAPAVQFIGPGSEYQTRGGAQQFVIDFVSPMDIKTIESRVIFNPVVKEKRWFYNESDDSVTFYGLEPSTEYSVTALAGMRDIYGNAINQSQSARFTTEPYDPFATLDMPYYESLLRAGVPSSFYVSYTNVKTIDFNLFNLKEEAILNYEKNGFQLDKNLPDPSTAIWTYQERSQAKPNEHVIREIPIRGAGEKPLPQGFYLLTMDTRDVSHQGPVLDGRLLIVASANLTFKQSNGNGLVWLTDLDSGKPIATSPIRVVDATNITVAEGTTGQDGLFTFNLPAWENENERPNYYAISTSEDHFAYTSSSMFSGVSPEDFGIWSSYYTPPQSAVAYLYTDRPLYRPDQPVYFKGIVRLDQDMAYQLPTEKKVEVTISSYKEEVYREELALSDFGSFDGKLMLDSSAALGSYTIEARFPDTDQVIGSGYFTVAEYRKPEFIVDATAAPDNIQVGGKFQAAITAEYYSGGPLAGAEVSWNLQSDPWTFTPPENLNGYSFYDEDVLQNQQTQKASASRQITEGVGVTDEDGKLALTLPADPQSIDPTRRLTFNVTITDFAGTSVSGQAALNAHRSQVYPGIKPESTVGLAGEQQTFDLAAVDWDGKPVSGQKLDVVISRREWFSVQQQDTQGVLRWVSTARDTPVATLNNITTDEQGLASTAFVPAAGGTYRARVTAFDKTGKSASATAYLWVSGAEYIPWQQENDRTFKLVTDRSAYKPGDQAEILIATPFQGKVYALVTVERGLIRSQEVILLDSNSAIYRLSIREDMAPSVYVSVVAVKGVDDTSPRPDYKMGMARIDVSTEKQQLDVEVTPDKKQASPGDEVSYTVKVTGVDGNPAQAEVSLGLADLSVLNLMEPNSGPILDYFYYRRSLQVSTALAMSSNLEEYNVRIKEQIAEGLSAGSGGGKGEGIPGVPDVRRNFPDTAYWNPEVVTDRDGKATVSLTLPDNLTTWRMDARAITQDTHAGQTTTDLISARPLLIRPQTPRFFVNGDRVVLGMGIHNNTGQDLDVSASLDASGVKLADSAEQKAHIADGQQAYISWKAEVLPGASRVDLTFSASGGGFKDSSKPTMGTLDDQGIPVYRYEAPETVSTSGELTGAGAVTEAIHLPQEMPITSGELNIEMEPSLAAGLRSGLAYLEHYPYECMEQTVSSFLPNILTTRALKTAGIDNPDLEENLRTQVTTALQRIYSQQNEDGGWGWWSGNSSSPLTSAYVALGLVEARNAGYTVTSDVIQRGMLYLSQQSSALQNDPESYAKYGKNTHAFILYVLARGGKPAISDTVRLVDHWQSLTLDGRAFLARALFEIDPTDTRLKELVSNLAGQAAISASGASWQDAERDEWNWSSETRTTAIVLDTILQIDPENPILVQGVRWLMKNRTDGRWGGTQATAWTLMALTDWMEKTGELQGSYSYALALNGTQIGEGQATTDAIDQVKTLTVAVADLLASESNRLVFARTEGPGNLYYTANLKVNLPVDQLKAVDQGVAISRKYYTLDNDKTPVTQAKQGELVRGRLTIVVPHDAHYLLVEDPLPAGLEGVDASLKTSPQGEAPEQVNWTDMSTAGWGWWYFDHVELRDEKVVLSADYLPAGTYVYTYLARAGTVGTFQVIPPTAQEFYFPDVYGRGDGSQFEVTP